tara:strand:+ start:89 stop:1255 length:1167 start_codon:yes stop_codon:yes gene_type:complete
MIYRASLFRLTNLAYKTASKRKLNFFINFIIFISLFAITASFLSMFYENKIDKLDTKRTLLDSQKIMLANQISTIPSSLNMIDIILSSKLKGKAYYKILKEVNPGGILKSGIINDEAIYSTNYYGIVDLIETLIIENSFYINSAEVIFENDNVILKEIDLYKKKNNSNKYELNNLYAKTSSDEVSWKEFEENNRYAEYGLIGVFFDIVPEGTLINSVRENSPADKSGIKIGDIVTSVNEISLEGIKNYEDAMEIINLKPNIPANFIIISKNKTIKKAVIIPELTFNQELYDLKDQNYYLKFKEYLIDIYKIMEDQRLILINFGLNFTSVNLKKINTEIIKINSELEILSNKESKAILFAFLIQLIIFFSAQYFEFSVGQVNEKKNYKK